MKSVSQDNTTARVITWVDCPACRQPSEYSLNNPYRPFCSKRCRITDLSRWAQEHFRVVETSSNEDQNI